ncbi:hypothetical protein [Aeromonas phage ZPAH34]|uniref:hypothetical protein n=1 Tax=Aeromonas phage ZPAH34 TaxID=2924888 RepID=UPI00232914D6|nr:hypothetical protein PQD16_gp183 [Aeromonas phage ZPAH34]UOX39500.1 hypothetical protein [Aeromonas phage ZPAH34]
MTISISDRLPLSVSEFKFGDKFIVKKILGEVGTIVEYERLNNGSRAVMKIHNLPFDECVNNPVNAKERMLVALFGRLFIFDNGRLTHRERSLIRYVRSQLPSEFGGSFKTSEATFDYRVVDDKISIYHKNTRILRTHYYQFSKVMKETLNDKRNYNSKGH